MKNILTLCILVLATFSVKAQDLNFEETVQYIEKIYKGTFKFGAITVTSIKCEGNIFIKTFSDNDTAKTNLLDIRELQLEPHYDGSKWHITYINQAGRSKAEYVLGHIQSESDAIILKKALEHLIELVKEKE